MDKCTWEVFMDSDVLSVGCYFDLFVVTQQIFRIHNEITEYSFLYRLSCSKSDHIVWVYSHSN